MPKYPFSGEITIHLSILGMEECQAKIGAFISGQPNMMEMTPFNIEWLRDVATQIVKDTLRVELELRDMHTQEKL
jgi:hypothetical protein